MRLAHVEGPRTPEAVLRRGTFAAAAEAPGITVAAVGQRVRALEDRLGRPLFERRPAGVVALCPALAAAADLAAGFGHPEDAFGALAAGPDDPLRLPTSRGFHDRWLAARLPRLSAAHPGLELRIDQSTLARSGA